MSYPPQGRIIHSYYAEAYRYASSDKIVIDTTEVFHAVQDLVKGLSNGWTWIPGTRNTDISVMETYNGDLSSLITTTAAHNLNTGDYITITGTTNYNDIYKVLSTPSATTFEINKPWDGNDDGTGTYSRGDTYECQNGASGIYEFNWGLSASMDIVNKACSAAILINNTPCEKCRSREYFTKTEYETVSGGGFLVINNGDRVCIIIKNTTDATDMTIRHANFRIYKMPST